MRRLLLLISIPVSFALLLLACQKETSFETGNPSGLAEGALQKDSFDNCFPITVSGVYREGKVLTDSNFVTVQLNITKPGQYRIFSDTMNGFWFSDSGFAASSGLQTVKVRAKGSPILPIPTSFSIFFGSSFCDFEVNVVPASSSGSMNDADTAWMFNEGTKHFQGHVDNAFIQGGLGFNALVIDGSPASADSSLFITLVLGASTTPSGSYSTGTGTAVFEFDDPSGNTIYSSMQGDGSNLTFTVTSYDATTKVFRGTFSGTVKDAAGMTKPVTLGKLNLQVQ